MRRRGSIQKRKKPCKNGMFDRKMKKKDEKGKMEELHQHKVAQMIKSAEGSKPAARRAGAQILKKGEEDARLLDLCEAKKKEWAKHSQCGEDVQNVEEKLWKMRN